jgi:hypothetical protein
MVALPFPTRQQWHGIAGRSTLTFCIFSAALFASLAVVRVAVVPLLTRVEVDGETRRLPDLLAEHGALAADLLSAETERDRLILPVHDERYQALRDRKQTRQSFPDLMRRINDLIRESEQNGRPTVMLQAMEADYEKHTIRLQGDTRNAGMSSMTVLAWFTDALRELPSVEKADTPQFRREEDPYIGQYSLFDITLTVAES